MIAVVSPALEDRSGTLPLSQSIRIASQQSTAQLEIESGFYHPVSHGLSLYRSGEGCGVLTEVAAIMALGLWTFGRWKQQDGCQALVGGALG